MVLIDTSRVMHDGSSLTDSIGIEDGYKEYARNRE